MLILVVLFWAGQDKMTLYLADNGQAMDHMLAFSRGNAAGFHDLLGLFVTAVHLFFFLLVLLFLFFCGVSGSSSSAFKSRLSNAFKSNTSFISVTTLALTNLHENMRQNIQDNYNIHVLNVKRKGAKKGTAKRPSRP
jgi:succinate dehydrogenase hydrophobic anchor subunit